MVAMIVGSWGSMSTVISGTVITAMPIASELATDVAVTVTCKSADGAGGAVYFVATPLAVDVRDTVPHGVGEHETVQLTPLFPVSFISVAVRRVLPVPSTVPAAGTTVTPTEGTTKVADADLVVSVADVPVRVTVRLLAGGVVGAV